MLYEILGITYTLISKCQLGFNQMNILQGFVFKC